MNRDLPWDVFIRCQIAYEPRKAEISNNTTPLVNDFNTFLDSNMGEFCH